MCAKQFAAAATTLNNAAKNAGDDATELKSMAAIYKELGSNYNVGMAPGTNAKEAFEKLRKALTLDNSAGQAFAQEIKAQIAKIAR